MHALQIPRLTRNQKVRFSALAITLLAAVAMVLIGTRVTGAYFSDTKDGNVSGTIGSIQVTTHGGSGANGLDFNMPNMLPGEPQTLTVHYSNSGSGAEDVYFKFPNATALSSLNDYGHYAELHITSNGTEIFASQNLNDHAATCPNVPSTDCRPLPSTLKLASNLAPGHSGTATFTFDYTGKLTAQPPAGTTEHFNEYPQSDQITVKASDGTGSGLPIQVVATQVGQLP